MNKLELIKTYIKNYFELKNDEYFAISDKTKISKNSYIIPIKTYEYRRKEENGYGFNLSETYNANEYWNLN